MSHAVWLTLLLFKPQPRSLCLNRSVSEASRRMPTEQGPHGKVKPCLLREDAQMGRLCAQSGAPLPAVVTLCL